MTALTPSRAGLPERSILLAFLAFVLVGGGASVAIRITYAELDPFWSSAARFGVAGVAFWIMVAYKKIPIPKGQALLGAVVFGSLTVGLAFVLIAWGLTQTPASLYQILMAMVPLLTLFLSALHGIESISRRGLLGSLLAVAGIAVTVIGAGSGDFTISIPHIIAIIVASVFVAEGGVVIKKFPPNPPVMTNAIGMTIGAIVMIIASLVTGESWTIPSQANTWIAFVYLVVFVTVVAFLLYMFVLGKWTASGTSYGFVLVPLVTIVVASTIAGETITVNFLIGAGLVLLGVLVGVLLPTKEKVEAVEECKDRSGQVLPRCL